MARSKPPVRTLDDGHWSPLDAASMREQGYSETAIEAAEAAVEATYRRLAQVRPVEVEKKLAAARPHGETLDRAREAHELIMAGARKTAACRKAHIDPRTYDRYAADLVNWEADEEL